MEAFVWFGKTLRVWSSNVRTIEYDWHQNALTVEYRDGRVYGYRLVTPQEAESFVWAVSKGGWVWDNLRIRGTVYGYRKPYFQLLAGEGMAQALEVNGECQARTGTGAVDALENLGVSVDGVTIEDMEMTEEVYTDTFGPLVPFDEQHFLQMAIIRAEMIFFDRAVIERNMARISGTAGQMGQAGTLWGAGGKYFRVVLLAPSNPTFPRNYTKCRFLGGQPQKRGTRVTRWDLTWRAIPYTGTAGVTTSGVLYNTTIT